LVILLKNSGKDFQVITGHSTFITSQSVFVSTNVVLKIHVAGQTLSKGTVSTTISRNSGIFGLVIIGCFVRKCMKDVVIMRILLWITSSLLTWMYWNCR